MTAPNILFIFTDQQNSSMMSCAGNPYVSTPAIDRIAHEGVRFDRAYCTNPVCVPSRFSLMTGHMPTDVDIRYNETISPDNFTRQMRNMSLGWLMRKAGYKTAYGGKVHIPDFTPEDLGFTTISTDERYQLARDCCDFIADSRDKPFCLVVCPINPHDICYMGIRDFPDDENLKRTAEHGKRQELLCVDEALLAANAVDEEIFFNDVCPPLPENFEPQKDEPEAVTELLYQRPFRIGLRKNWTEQQWRLHRWVYARLTERVDGQIGMILDALERSGQAEHTIVLFSSDHGDHDASHRIEHKTALYEEACRIPLIIKEPGMSSKTRVDTEHLVSNGLDIVPTLCDYAGVDPPEALEGRSLRPLLEGESPADWREVVPIESEIGFGLVSQTHKYAVYDSGSNREQLYDLESDPGETENAIQKPEQKQPLAAMRRALARRMEQT